jgi:hypothetical protein
MQRLEAWSIFPNFEKSKKAYRKYNKKQKQNNIPAYPCFDPCCWSPE